MGYSKTRKAMLAFSMMADTEEAKNLDGGRTEIQEKILESYKKSLQEKETKDLIGNWDCNHEPWLTIYNDLEQNLTAFFEHQEENEIVIAVAGTNFTSHFDWFVEDLEVSTLIPWNKDIVNFGDKNTGSGENGYVSKGTARALSISWTQAIGDDNNSDEKKGDPSETPMEYLQTLLKSKLSEPLTLYVTGHSLGGAISPAMAQAIADHVGDWDLDGANLDNLTIKTYPFAGPTPGDDTFLNYVYEKAERKIEVHSTVNRNDVVPHAWQLVDETLNGFTIENISSLYSSVLTANKEEDKRIVEATVQMLLGFSEHAKSNNHIYKRWKDELIVEGELSDFGDKVTVEIGAFNGVIQAHLSLPANKNVRDALFQIAGLNKENSKVMELTPYLQYFCTFLVHLANQHISAYKEIIFEDSENNNTWFKIIDPIAIIKKLETGLSVLDTLFLKVNEYNSNKEKLGQPKEQ
ncbi:lipase family protein [Gracilimonas mengyeensis]|uniref:Lipase (Class 3) n=1 Tax=Gracilimonas mengyeensis TaxID=1302730 RepID=A0A521AUB9_9BACT|nr:hypothetical protein [Gracilimonas mengyeensis]SMO38448.1 Lipase (class 3) [Gracilimonas mengyeensis]